MVNKPTKRIRFILSRHTLSVQHVKGGAKGDILLFIVRFAAVFPRPPRPGMKK
jgi:hypothetical protein